MALGVGEPKTIAYFVKQSFGFYGQALHGETFHRNMVAGKILIVRFCRWRDKGTWEHVLANLMDMPDFEWLMIDSTYCKVHAHAAGAKDGNQDMSRTKGGSTLK